MKKFFLISFTFLFACSILAQNANDMLNLSTIQTGVKSKRVSSYDKSGGNNDRVEHVKPGESLTLCDIKGAGIINHIWITIAPPPPGLSRNDIIIKMYWDGNDEPSVHTPIGPFFGQGWNESYNYSSLPLSAAPVEGRALVSYFAMPFENGARIEVVNENSIDVGAFYYYIDYVEMKTLPENSGRFHAWYNHELTESLPEGENEWGMLGTLEGIPNGTNLDGKDNYLFVETEGKGHFVGVNYYVHSPSPMWYGEGDDMIFIDGNELPTLFGTGTEDYFNTSWCPKEEFSHPHFGYARVNNDIGWLGRTHVYRFHIADPIYFDKSFKFSIEHAHNNAMTLDLASVAYWYQTKAMAVPDIPNKVQRAPKPFITAMDIHKWRHAWRNSLDNYEDLWGDEKVIMKDPVPAWNVLGPLEVEGSNPLSNTYDAEELDLTQKYKGKNDVEVIWETVEVTRKGFVDLDLMFNYPDHTAALAYSKVWAPAKKKYTIYLGSDDGARLKVNGKVVHENNVQRGASPDNDKIEVELNEGWNDISLLINDKEGGWGFYIRFDDPQKELKYKID